MNISLSLFVFVLALLVPDIVEAESGNGRIEFSGTVVEQTCWITSRPVAVVPETADASTRISHCQIDPASAHSQAVSYTSSTRALRADESDLLLRYLAERATAAGTIASTELQTVTYL